MYNIIFWIYNIIDFYYVIIKIDYILYLTFHFIRLYFSFKSIFYYRLEIAHILKRAIFNSTSYYVDMFKRKKCYQLKHLHFNNRKL